MYVQHSIFVMHKVFLTRNDKEGYMYISVSDNAWTLYDWY